MNKDEIEKTLYSNELIQGSDKLGFWYKSLASLGESVVFNFGQESQDGMSWSYYKHEEFDGISALHHYLKRNYKVELDIPKLNDKHRAPGFLLGLLGFIKYQKSRKLPYFTWKKRDFTKGLTFNDQEKKYVKLTFNPEESKQLFQHLKNKEINFNSLCMIFINTFILENFIETHQGEFLWMLPVNMRGQIKKNGTNQSSYLDLVLSESETSSSLRSKMISKMTNKEHWFVWYGAQFIPRLFSKKAFQIIKNHLLDQGPPYVGNFSNLGRHYVDCDINKPIFLGTNVTKVRPIGLGLLSINDHLTMTLQFHETLGLDSKSLNTLSHEFQLLKRKFFSI